jgi:uncharacterized protein YkwD
LLHRIHTRRNRRIVRLALAAVALTAALSATEATSLAQAPAQYRVAYRPAYTGYTYTQPAQTQYAQPTYTYPQQGYTYAQPGYTYAQPSQPQQATTATSGDPYGFTAWLNSTRAQYGLPAVGYDPNLANWAAQNSAQQNARGLGHHVMGPARRQNSAMGNYASIGAMWMASPAHRAALLDPTISFVGIAGAGAYWTFNAY